MPSTIIIADEKIKVKQRHCVAIPAAYNPSSDVMARFANWLLRETALYPERMEQAHWIPLSREYGRAMFGGGKWHKVIDEATQVGLVERHHSYWTGEQGARGFPKAVRLARCFRTGETKIYTLSRKPRQSSSQQASRLRNLGEVGSWLHGRLSSFHLPDSIRPNSYWDAYIQAVIRSGNHYATRCGYGRLHTPFTVLTAQQRQHLRTGDRQHLSSIDIKQAQPTLLHAMVCNNKVSKSVLLICGTNVDVYDALLPYARRCEPYTEIAKSTKRRPKTSSSRAKTIKSGTSYKRHQPSYWTRDDVKANLLKAMFAPNNIMVRQPAYRALRELSPVHAEFMLEYKKENHKRLAGALQKMESTIVIDGVCGWLMANYPDSPVLTIHDELIIPTELVEPVGKQLKIQFQKLGVAPQLEINQLSA